MENKLTTRYNWIDNIKFAACILVVIGHLLMSMVSSKIMPENTFYNVFIQSLYTFHVPLFFVCSGFLYQKSNRVHTFDTWYKNVLDKLLNLGVPYFTFSIITLLLKYIFSSEVNNQAGGFFQTLFIEPTAPYWYLYALFFMFLLIPCFKTKKQANIALSISIVLVVIYIICSNNNVNLPYILNMLTGRPIWFVFGMWLAFQENSKKYDSLLKASLPVLIFIAIFLSIKYYRVQNDSTILRYVVGIMFVVFTVIIANLVKPKFLNDISMRFSEYFMPVFVLHTIVSATARTILFKIGITNLFIHIVVGLIVGFAIPMLIYVIAKKIPFLQFFIYPKKAIKAIKGKSK